MAGPRFSRRSIARTIAAKLVAEPSRRQFWIEVLAAYLVEQNRVAEADLIINDIENELYEQDGQLLVRTVSARPLTDEVRSELIGLLTDKTKARQVILNESVDPTLLGGLVARTAQAELDTSVRTTLNRLATIN